MYKRQVSREVKQRWQHTLSCYLQERDCLRGLIVLVDIRHDLKETDQQTILWAAESGLGIHILLTKADKLGKNARKSQQLKLEAYLKAKGIEASTQCFSSLKKEGVDELVNCLNGWFE